MAKYELVKETTIDGLVRYSIELNGRYVSRTVTDNIEQAEIFLNTLVKGGNLETIKETIKTIEVDEN